ncbi:MAG: cyclase family protein [Stygiobacter sp.]
MNRFIYLSYFINEDLPTYGNDEKIKIVKTKSIISGDSSNNSFFSFSGHIGTHIDYPFHFCNDGRKSSDYSAGELIFFKIGFAEIDMTANDNFIIEKQMFQNINLSSDIDFLLIKTGYCKFRKDEKYWQFNPGFHPNLAQYFKRKFPSIKAIGFDSISLSCYQKRELGRLAHKKFLCENDILIIEDMNLSEICVKSNIKKLIAAPLLIENVDGVPVTVIAEIEE